MNRPTYLRLASIALAVAGVLFALFPLTRPWDDAAGDAAGLMAATASSWWIPSHLFGALAFMLAAFASTGVLGALMKSTSERPARLMAFLAILGAGLILPYYGAESFGLHAVSVTSAGADPAAAQLLMEAIRNDPYALGTFGAGLLAVAVAGILLAVAVRRSASGTSLPALATAVLLAAYLPQFFGPPWLRVIHGVLLGVSLIALAWWHHTAAGQKLRSESAGPVAAPTSSS